MADLVEVCGLWSSKSKDGTPYISGRLGNAKVLIFKNTKKGDNEKAPDYRLMMTAWETRKKGSDSGGDDGSF